MLAREARIECAETIDERFQLRAHAVIVQRRCEYEHIGAQYLLTDLPNRVLLYAGAFVPATHAAGTGTNIRVRDFNDLDRMPRSLAPRRNASASR